LSWLAVVGAGKALTMAVAVALVDYFKRRLFLLLLALL
jgi:hypothetical protein